MCVTTEMQCIGKITSFANQAARMIEQEITKIIALWIDSGLLAQARGTEKRKCLQCFQCCQAFCHGHRAAGDYKKSTEKKSNEMKRRKKKQKKNVVKKAHRKK